MNEQYNNQYPQNPVSQPSPVNNVNPPYYNQAPQMDSNQMLALILQEEQKQTKYLKNVSQFAMFAAVVLLFEIIGGFINLVLNN
ncbi:MAG: hypothetical protein K5761_01615 [Clostridiales bacterium]|nr:hypothetical protein [Clostridiales bacterium]